MCANGVNTQQLKDTITQIDETVALTRRWTHRMYHLADNGQLEKTAKKLSQIQGMFDDIRAELDEVQDLIAVVIMSKMDNKEEYLEIADKYMSDYMKPTIHHINKVMASGAGNKYKEKMKNPPIYKPKKQKSRGLMTKLMGGGQQGLNNSK